MKRVLVVLNEKDLEKIKKYMEENGYESWSGSIRSIIRKYFTKCGGSNEETKNN